uniref:Matrix metallopeptidase 12 n=1 Tax=Mus musculus TaxID=10090 RepID=D6RJI9_MOUSE
MSCTLLKGVCTMKFLMMIVFLQVSACGAAPMNDSEFAEGSQQKPGCIQPCAMLVFYLVVLVKIL